MSLEVPFSLIADIQVITRREANLSSCDPDGDLHTLPSFHDSISELDPSPDYLRCKHCHGRLPNGVNSIICVFCGAYPENRLDAAKFKSTVGFRWFLDFLNLDGSEQVEVQKEEEAARVGSTRNSTPGTVISLSDLLDLEVKWTAPETKTPIKKFFQDMDSENIDSSLSQSTNKDEKDAREGKQGDGWEADFQFVHAPESQVILSEDVKNATAVSSLPIISSSFLSEQLDNVFGTDKKPNDRTISSPQSFLEYDDFWHDNVGDASKTGLEGDLSCENASSPIDIDWLGDNHSHTRVETNIKTADITDESVGWNDFGSPINGTVNDDFDAAISRIDQEEPNSSELSCFKTVINSQAVNFNGLSETSDLFMAQLDNQNSHAATTNSIMDSTSSVHWDIKNECINGSATPSNEDVEAIILQMHDLSFMLAPQLSIPPPKKH